MNPLNADYKSMMYINQAINTETHPKLGGLLERPFPYGFRSACNAFSFADRDIRTLLNQYSIPNDDWTDKLVSYVQNSTEWEGLISEKDLTFLISLGKLRNGDIGIEEARKTLGDGTVERELSDVKLELKSKTDNFMAENFMAKMKLRNIEDLEIRIFKVDTFSYL